MTNVLKKVEIGNPLINLELWDELAEYQTCQTDEELADLYHKLLDKSEAESNSILQAFTHAMITHSTGFSFNPQILLP